MLKKKIVIFYITTIIFILDRLSKYFILELSNSVEKLNMPITSFLNLNLIWNDGIAFGLFSFKEQFYYNIITIIIIIITLAILFLAIKSSGIEKISFSMIFGGSLGNIFDRLYYRAVVDFIDININNIHWFIFNIADIFICLGVITLITIEFFSKKKI
jgi:signal peptidase II|tara:strand:- start:6389 stop:6862 length:474 start_codon:yes stop_codon:yes gene_type:complete